MHNCMILHKGVIPRQLWESDDPWPWATIWGNEIRSVTCSICIPLNYISHWTGDWSACMLYQNTSQGGHIEVCFHKIFFSHKILVISCLVQGTPPAPQSNFSLHYCQFQQVVFRSLESQTPDKVQIQRLQYCYYTYIVDLEFFKCLCLQMQTWTGACVQMLTCLYS